MPEALATLSVEIFAVVTERLCVFSVATFRVVTLAVKRLAWAGTIRLPKVAKVLALSVTTFAVVTLALVTFMTG